MPLGTYQYKPKYEASQSLFMSDIEEFIFVLLKDICSESTNPILSGGVVNYENDLNYADLEGETGATCLVSFVINREDPRNTNLAASLNDNASDLQVVYEVGLIAKKDVLSSILFLRAFEEIQTAITANWNGTAGQPSPYRLTLTSGKTLSSNLTTNEPDPFPFAQINQENPEQPNYLTVTNNIMFNLNNNT